MIHQAEITHLPRESNTRGMQKEKNLHCISRALVRLVRVNLGRVVSSNKAKGGLSTTENSEQIPGSVIIAFIVKITNGSWRVERRRLIDRSITTTGRKNALRANGIRHLRRLKMRTEESQSAETHL